MAHIIEYTKKRLAQIKANYDTELAKAKNLLLGRGNGHVESDFTDKELAELDKMVRATLGKDYEVHYVIKDSLLEADCKQSYCFYGIIHKDLFARSKGSYDKMRMAVDTSDSNRIIISNHSGDNLSTKGYSWLSFNKESTSHTILYCSTDVETFGIKPKNKNDWCKDKPTYLCYEILFYKYLDACRKGIERVKQQFEQFV